MRVRISPRSRDKFADFAQAHGTPATIRRAFQREGFEPQPFVNLTHVRGECRAIVASFHADVTFADPKEQQRLLRVYVNALEDRPIDPPADGSPIVLPPEAVTLIASLQRDGANIDDAGRLILRSAPPPVLELGQYDRLRDPTVLQVHLRRIESNLAADPPTAIAAAKELVESTCKFVLDDYGIAYEQSAGLQELYKATARALCINREAVDDSVRGSQAAQRILQNLSSLVQGMAELRNELGIGHGRTTNSAAMERHARLAFNSARTAVEFILETWHHRKGQRRQAA